MNNIANITATLLTLGLTTSQVLTVIDYTSKGYSVKFENISNKIDEIRFTPVVHEGRVALKVRESNVTTGKGSVSFI